MTENISDNLSRRERQIMDIIYRLGEATVNDVLENMSDPPSYSAVRAFLRILVKRTICGTNRTGRGTSTGRLSHGKKSGSPSSMDY